MKAFIGINILMGINKPPVLIDYWSSDEALGMPYISHNMPSMNLTNCIRLGLSSISGRKSLPGSCIPGKPFLLIEKWLNLMVDCCEKYMPKKPVNLGIKLWCLCDSLNEYCLAFSIYCTHGRMMARKKLNLAWHFQLSWIWGMVNITLMPVLCGWTCRGLYPITWNLSSSRPSCLVWLL